MNMFQKQNKKNQAISERMPLEIEDVPLKNKTSTSSYNAIGLGRLSC